REEVILYLHEDNVAAAFPLNGLAGYDYGFGLVAHDNRGRAKGVGQEPAIGVEHFRPGADGPRPVIHLRADPADLAIDAQVLRAVGPEDDRLPDADAGSVALRHVRVNPHALGVRDDDESG